VVGFPNVGKSSLVNRLAGARDAVTHAEAGVTRDRKRLACEWNGVSFDLIDTGGIDLEDEADLSQDVQTQAAEAMREADAILMVVDGRAGLRQGDAELARVLRRSDVPVLVCVNKADRPDEGALLTSEFHQLGLGEPLAVSATHGLGTGDLLDRLVEALAEAPPREESDRPQIAVIGRPNVGKSSLVNALLGSERVIVSPMAGTTRDAIDTDIEVDGQPLTLVDTAGLRRRSKVAGTIDYYAQLRAEKATERADVAILLCDASEGVTSEDFRISEIAMKAGCATLVALNKWDETRTDLDDAKARISRKLRLRPPVVTCSAKTGRNLAGLIPRSLQLAESRARRIPTPELNRFVGDVVGKTPPPAKRGRRLHLLYSAQVGTEPPRFAIQVNDRKLISRSWAFHLENRLREAFGFEGVPVIIDFIQRSGRGRRAPGEGRSRTRA
jgi:GTP-binding protein